MKYKNIRSAIHNFGHSFMSDMNYVDDDFIFNDLVKIHKKNLDISIDWLNGIFEPSSEVSDRLKKSIGYWKNGLEKQLSQQNVDLNMIASLFLYWPSKATHFMEAKDDRGKVYKIEIVRSK